MSDKKKELKPNTYNYLYCQIIIFFWTEWLIELWPFISNNNVIKTNSQNYKLKEPNEW